MIIENNITNTTPLVLHAQGVTHFTNKWTNLVNKIVNIDLNTNIPDDLLIITFNANYIYSPLTIQLEKSNIPYINAAKNFSSSKKWENKYKIELTLDSIYDTDKKYILSLDALDVVLSESFGNIIEEFNKFNVDLLFGASNNRFPPIETLKELKDVTIGHPFLNAGTVIGTKDAFIKFYSKVNTIKDTELNGEWLNSEQHRIKVAAQSIEMSIDFDNESKIFQTVGGLNFNYLNNIVTISK